MYRAICDNSLALKHRNWKVFIVWNSRIEHDVQGALIELSKLRKVNIPPITHSTV